LFRSLKNGGEAVRPSRERSAFPGPAVTRGRDGRAGHRQSFTHALPKAGFSAPITLTVLPQTLTGMWTGTWITLPERTPGEPIAAPWAPESAKAGAAMARAISAPATTAALFFMKFPFSAVMPV